ncbi:MAG: hypothetical protein JST55_05630 [Bacteroidetes bacterium]|nr:hypothetical protein [Bacteroidota bacterium]
MKKSPFLFILAVFTIFLNSSSYSQTLLNFNPSLQVSKFISTQKTSYPIFLPHIGIGFASGVRAGLMVQATENFSGEISAGYDLANFTSASDEEKRYGVGVSYRYSEKIPVFISALFAIGDRGEKANLRSPKYYYSLNAGYIWLTKFSMNFFARGGFALRYYYERSTETVHYDTLLPNIDIGFGYSF